MNWFDARHLTLGGARISYTAILFSLGVLIFGFFSASKVAERIRHLGVPSPRGQRWRASLAQIVGYVLRLLSVLFALQVAGVDFASVLAAGAVVAVGVGIAMQKVAENFVSGIILLAERSIREGDIIEFGGNIARVEHMGIRATIALTLDDEELIVPNSILTQAMVKNLTLTEHVYRLRMRIGVSYESDLDQTLAVLKAAAEAIEWRDRRREPVVLLTEFAPSSVDFEVSVWTADVWGMRRGQSAARRDLWRALRDAGISIPLPQLDLRIKRLQVANSADDMNELRKA